MKSMNMNLRDLYSVGSNQTGKIVLEKIEEASNECGSSIAGGDSAGLDQV